VLAPQQRDRLAEPPAMQVHETGAVRVFLLCHPVERTRGRRVIDTQALRVPPVNARIVLLRRNGERENLLLGQVLELPPVRDAWNHGCSLSCGASERRSRATAGSSIGGGANRQFDRVSALY
jgi:hypothetical protein